MKYLVRGSPLVLITNDKNLRTGIGLADSAHCKVRRRARSNKHIRHFHMNRVSRRQYSLGYFQRLRFRRACTAYRQGGEVEQSKRCGLGHLYELK